jgi:hypothetical protein
MVFESSSPPRRSCEPFTELLSSGALAGFAGDSDCLSPLVDAFRRHDKVTCPGETPASRAGDNVSTNEIHCAVSKTSKLCKEAGKVIDLIASSPPRKPGKRKTTVADSDERLNAVVTTLEECRTVLIETGSRETALLVSVAILELRMKLNQVTESELKALCDAMLAGEASAASPPRRAVLKLVK